MRALAFAALFLAGLAAAGCSELPDRDVTCRNGVIDPGESCDNNDPTCQQCQLTCANHTDEECAAAGSGYRCGADDVCHAASGWFLPTPRREFSFPVAQGTVADLDGDRIGDIIGFSDINIDVRFGDPAFSLDTRAGVIVPFSNTSLAVRSFPAYVDTSGSSPTSVPPLSDILLPTSDGLAGFTARGKSLVSYPFSNAPGARGDCALDPDPVTHIPRAQPVQAFSIDKHHLAFVRRNRMTHALDLAVLDPTNTGSDQCEVTPLCSLSTDFGEASKYVVLYDHYDLTPSATERTSSIIAISAVPTFDASMMTPASACVVHFTDDPTRPAGAHFGFRAMPLSSSTIGGSASVVLARTDSSSVCPALYAQAPTGGVVVYPPSATTPCTLSAAQSVGPWALGAMMPTGRIPLVPPIASRAPDAVVITTSDGFGGTTDVFAVSSPTAAQTTPLAHLTRPLFHMRSADLNGDSRVEGIGVVSLPLDRVTSGQPDLDILYRTTGGPDGFIVYHVPTISVPTHIELGDFDGNGLPDIALTEHIGAGDELLVAYSTPDRPLDPVEVATFNYVGSMQRMDLGDSVEPTGEALDDLVIADVVSPTSANLAILHGNPQRTMLAYYDPRNVLTNPTKLLAALAGNFDASDPTVDVALFEDSSTPSMFVVRGIPHSEGLLDPPVTLKTPALITTPCPFGSPVGKICLQGGRLITWSLADRDVIISGGPPVMEGPTNIDFERKLAVLDPLQAAQGTLAPQFSPAMIDQNQVLSEMVAADLDGTGKKNLLVSLISFIEVGDPDHDEVATCTVDDNGVPQQCTDLAARFVDLAGWKCRTALNANVRAAGRLDPKPDVASDDIVMLCKAPGGTEGHVFRVTRDPAGGLVAQSLLGGPQVAEFVFLAVGDVNGDMVDDIIGISFDHATLLPFLHVYQQCTAEDLSCIQASKAAGSSLAFAGGMP